MSECSLVVCGLSEGSTAFGVNICNCKGRYFVAKWIVLCSNKLEDGEVFGRNGWEEEQPAVRCFCISARKDIEEGGRT